MSSLLIVEEIQYCSFDFVVPTGSVDSFESAKYEPKSSSTSKSLNKDFTLNYGSGGVKGTEYNDTVTVGGFTVRPRSTVSLHDIAKLCYRLLARPFLPPILRTPRSSAR